MSDVLMPDLHVGSIYRELTPPHGNPRHVDTVQRMRLEKLPEGKEDTLQFIVVEHEHGKCYVGRRAFIFISRFVEPRYILEGIAL